MAPDSSFAVASAAVDCSDGSGKDNTAEADAEEEEDDDEEEEEAAKVEVDVCAGPCVGPYILRLLGETVEKSAASNSPSYTFRKSSHDTASFPVSPVTL